MPLGLRHTSTLWCKILRKMYLQDPMEGRYAKPCVMGWYSYSSSVSPKRKV
jgi:hypothetical protein